MDKIIRDHLTSRKIYFIIYLPSFKIKYSRERDRIVFSFHDDVGIERYRYEHYDYNSFCDEIITTGFRKNLISLLINGETVTRHVDLTTPLYKFRWNKNIRLVEETYYTDERNMRGNLLAKDINYVNESKVISYNLLYFIYDFKSFLDSRVNLSLLNLEKYCQKNLKKIAEGHLNLALDLDIFFYVDDIGKINAVTVADFNIFHHYHDECFHRYYTSLSKHFIRYIRNNPTEIRNESEKLRINFRSYIPRLFE